MRREVTRWVIYWSVGDGDPTLQSVLSSRSRLARLRLIRLGLIRLRLIRLRGGLDSIHRVARDLLRPVNQLLARFTHVLVLDLRSGKRQTNRGAHSNCRGTHSQRVLVQHALQTASSADRAFLRLMANA